MGIFKRKTEQPAQQTPAQVLAGIVELFKQQQAQQIIKVAKSETKVINGRTAHPARQAIRIYDNNQLNVQ